MPNLKTDSKLNQHGGENTASYSGNKSNSNLPQHGGENSGVSKRTDTKLSQHGGEYVK